MAKYSRFKGLSDDLVRIYVSEAFSNEDPRLDSRLTRSLSPKALQLIRSTNCAIIGCGTVGSPLALLMAKKGYGINPHYMVLCDFDLVELENLPTQIYRRDQVGMPKSFALAEVITESTPFETKIIAINAEFSEMVELIPGVFEEVDLVLATVDSGLWRGKISNYVHRKAAFVTGGLSIDTTFGWVMWHTPDMPGFVDLLPYKASGVSPGCAGVIADASYMIAGLMSYVADHALFKLKGHREPNMPLGWQYRRIFMSGLAEDEFIIGGGHERA